MHTSSFLPIIRKYIEPTTWKIKIKTATKARTAWEDDFLCELKTTQGVCWNWLDSSKIKSNNNNNEKSVANDRLKISYALTQTMTYFHLTSVLLSISIFKGVHWPHTAFWCIGNIVMRMFYRYSNQCITVHCLCPVTRNKSITTSNSYCVCIYDVVAAAATADSFQAANHFALNRIELDGIWSICNVLNKLLHMPWFFIDVTAKCSNIFFFKEMICQFAKRPIITIYHFTKQLQ